jgi:hypothetical protein
MKSKTKRINQLIVGIFISVIALYFTVRGLDWETVLKGFSAISIQWYIAATIIMIMTIWLRAYRWTFFLTPTDTPSVYTLHKGVMIGYFGNNILPFRLGEVLRAYSTSRLTGYNTAYLFSTIIIERLVDVFSFFFFLMGISLVAPLPEWAENTRIFLGIVIGGIILFFLVYYRFHKHLTRYIDAKQGRFWQIISHLNHGFIAVFEMKYRLYVFILSIGLWALYALVFWLGFKMFGLNLGFMAASVLLATSSFAISIPSVPGYVGTYHAAVVQTLLFYGLDKSTAFTYAVVVHLVGFLSLTLIGFIYYIRTHLSVRSVTLESEALK